MRIFTKRFFALPQYDQVHVVNAALADLEACVGGCADEAGREKTTRQIRRIRRKAVDFGIFPQPHQQQGDDMPAQAHAEVPMGYKITVEQLVAALSGFRPDLPVGFHTEDAMGCGLQKIRTDQGVCEIHSSGDGESLTVGELLGRLNGIPTTMGVVMREDGIAEAKAVSLPFEDEDGYGPCVNVTAFCH